MPVVDGVQIVEVSQVFAEMWVSVRFHPRKLTAMKRINDVEERRRI